MMAKQGNSEKIVIQGESTTSSTIWAQKEGTVTTDHRKRSFMENPAVKAMGKH